MRMVSELDRVGNAAWEIESPYDNQDVVLPAFQAEVSNAAMHDPFSRRCRALWVTKNHRLQRFTFTALAMFDIDDGVVDLDWRDTSSC